MTPSVTCPSCPSTSSGAPAKLCAYKGTIRGHTVLHVFATVAVVALALYQGHRVKSMGGATVTTESLQHALDANRVRDLEVQKALLEKAWSRAAGLKDPDLMDRARVALGEVDEELRIRRERGGTR